MSTEVRTSVSDSSLIEDINQLEPEIVTGIKLAHHKPSSNSLLIRYLRNQLTVMTNASLLTRRPRNRLTSSRLEVKR